MMDIVLMLLVVILSPAILIITLGFWSMVGAIISRFETSPPLYCDIDPLCHPAFIWKGGDGWIRDQKVRTYQ
jgi:hypothetical protein